MTKNEAIETLYACSESGLYLRRGVIGKDVSEEEVARRLREVAAALDPAGDERYLRLKEACALFLDDDMCSYDHHGNCQTHGWHDDGEKTIKCITCNLRDAMKV